MRCTTVGDLKRMLNDFRDSVPLYHGGVIDSQFEDLRVGFMVYYVPPIEDNTSGGIYIDVEDKKEVSKKYNSII
jgi:hypothetical protein